MSRVIKFRGVHPSTGVVMDVCVIDWMHDEVYFEQGSDVSYSIEDCKLMQFTGLTDKSGVEIYEGDIVYCVTRDPFGHPEQDAQFVVEFDYGSFLAMTASEEQEVIGNTHQNPELIKE